MSLDRSTDYDHAMLELDKALDKLETVAALLSVIHLGPDHLKNRERSESTVRTELRSAIADIHMAQAQRIPF